jgi:hypothetical protein
LTANVRGVAASNGTEQQILGNLNQFDGLIINGSVISFVTKYLTTGECRVSYDMQIPRKVNVVGAYGIDRNMLWVDGVLVGETEVTESQKADKFTTSGANLYSGASISDNQIIINGIGVYSRVLNGDEIEDIDDASNIYPEIDSVPAMYGGVIIDVAQRENSIFLSQKYDTEELWRSGQLSGVSIRDDALVPTFESNISLPGYWLSTFNLGILDSTSMFGTNINWDGTGVVVEVSVNGTTWQTCYQPYR